MTQATKLTKLAIERAESKLLTMKRAKMAAWIEEHPEPEVRKVGFAELLKVALKDPGFRAALIRNAESLTEGPYSAALQITPRLMIENSPRAKALLMSRERALLAWRKEHDARQAKLEAACQNLLDEAIIRNVTPDELYARLTRF